MATCKNKTTIQFQLRCNLKTLKLLPLFQANNQKNIQLLAINYEEYKYVFPILHENYFYCILLETNI